MARQPGVRSGRLLLAFSGGPDSTALFYALLHWCRAHSRPLAAAHLNHGLRGRASDQDAVFVRKLCRAKKVPLLARKADTAAFARQNKMGLEEAARFLRYRFLAQAARRRRCTHVLTAHTADDQAETFFLNLVRGAGPAGLAAMAENGPWPFPAEKNPPRLARPFLAFEKKELLAFLKAGKKAFRTDATNAQPLFARNRLRPQLQKWEEERPGFLRRLGQLAQILNDEEAFWDAALAPLQKRSARRTSVGQSIDRGLFLSYNIAIQRRLLKRFFPKAGFEAVERLRRFFSDAPDSSEIHVPGGRCIRRKNRVLCEPWQK
jgi:tRNA(Ile)-lysidine synthase